MSDPRPARKYNRLIEEAQMQISDVFDEFEDDENLVPLMRVKVKKALDDLKMPEGRE
jgi:hypothetical protein